MTKFRKLVRSAIGKQGCNKVGDRITVVSGSNIMNTDTGITPQGLTANNSSIFGSRVAALSLLYQDYRITALDFKLLPLGAIHALAVEVEYPETVFPTTVGMMAQMAHFDLINGSTSVPGRVTLDKRGLLKIAANKWFKTNLSAGPSEVYQGLLMQYTSAANQANSVIVRYVIEFCNPITSGVGLSSAICSNTYVNVEVPQAKAASLATMCDSQQETAAPPPTSRFGFLRK
jgi:hypothetical protein